MKTIYVGKWMVTGESEGKGIEAGAFVLLAEA